jgi:hypothetical protein
MTTQDYQSHIAKIASENGVTIQFKPNCAARGYRKSRKVKLRPILSANTYAVALHELGHVLGPQTGNRLNEETQAWVWAKANALEWRKPMKNVMKRCLTSYLRWCQRRKGAWIPPKTHPAWRLAA